jgi:hypothetical protein
MGKQETKIGKQETEISKRSRKTEIGKGELKYVTGAGKPGYTKIGLGKERSGGANNRSSDRGNTGLVGKRKITMENESAVELKLDGEKQNTDSGNPSGG